MTRTIPYGLGPPPTRAPVQVTRRMALRGKSVRVSTPEGYWEGRAFTDPVWRDPNGRTWSAKVGVTPPADAILERTTLQVGGCTEHDWIHWCATNREPLVVYWIATNVWVDLAI